MYLFWWNKPLLPNEPIVLRDDSLAPLAAFMYSSSEMSGYVSPKRVRSQTWVKTLFAYLSLYSKTPEIERLCIRVPLAPAIPCGQRDVEDYRNAKDNNSSTGAGVSVVEMPLDL